MKSTSTLVVVCLVALGLGCGESGMTGSTVDTMPGETVADSQAVDTAQPDTATEDGGTPDTTSADTAASDTSAPDAGPGVGCEPGDGCFGESCDGNDDCLSGVCHACGRLCLLKTCDATCHEGWSCKLVGGVGDGGYACVSDTSHLCLPCATSADCASDESVNACVSYGEEGSFCGAACEASEDCPSGYSCEDVETVDGVTSKQCVANSGVCSCTNLAISSARSTPCHIENEFGLCEGIRACGESGLTDCNALEPSMEICNGIDDNCNGIDDEGTCDDGNDCTIDTCDGANGCTYEPIDGGECLDGDPCTVADNCQAGQCVGTPVECKDDNPCTDDGCDGAGGCTFTFNSEPCDDGDPCTLADTCQEGACAPTVDLTCDDNNPCTDDVCSDTGCIHSPLAGACDDGNACTEGDACQNGACLGLSAVFCDDGNTCTSDSCSPADGCISTPNAAPCDDGDLCTLKDTCKDGACAPSGVALNYTMKTCTDYVCNAITGCAHLPNAASGRWRPSHPDDTCSAEHASQPRPSSVTITIPAPPKAASPWPDVNPWPTKTLATMATSAPCKTPVRATNVKAAQAFLSATTKTPARMMSATPNWDASTPRMRTFVTMETAAPKTTFAPSVSARAREVLHAVTAIPAPWIPATPKAAAPTKPWTDHAAMVTPAPPGTPVKTACACPKPSLAATMETPAPATPA